MAALRLKLPVVLLAALLSGACKRAPAPVVEESPDLAPPAPSSSLVARPLSTASTGYTNEMQAAALTKETAELGIQQISTEIEEAEPKEGGTGPAPAPMNDAQRKAHLAQLKQMRLEFSRARRGIESARDRSVALEGSTAQVIKGRESGGMLGPAEDAPGIWSGAYGGAVETGERVVEDAAVWAELWGRLSREAPPAIDFKTTRVAAVFAGPRPTAGFRARLIGTVTEPGRYVLRWYEEGPGPGEAPADGETAPFLLASVPKDDRAIRWEKVRHQGRAEGPKKN